MANNKKDPIENILNLKSLKAIQDKIDLELDIYITKFNFKSLFDKYIEKILNTNNNFLDKIIKQYLDKYIINEYLSKHIKKSKSIEQIIFDYLDKNPVIIEQIIKDIIPKIIKEESTSHGYIYNHLKDKFYYQFDNNLKNLNIDFKITNIKK